MSGFENGNFDDSTTTPEKPDAATETVVSPAGGNESREVEPPTLTLNVADHCNNPDGLYVGLSKDQRGKLGVKVGGTVILRESGTKKIIGLYVVGLGSEKLKGDASKFTANGVEIGQMIEVCKATEVNLPNSSLLDVSMGVESQEKHEKRKSTISERFGDRGFDGESYIVLPTALAKLLTHQEGKARVASIALGRVEISGGVIELPVVPAGTGFGVTTNAARQLGLPALAKRGDFYVNKAGVLVLNQLVEND